MRRGCEAEAVEVAKKRGKQTTALCLTWSRHRMATTRRSSIVSTTRVAARWRIGLPQSASPSSRRTARTPVIISKIQAGSCRPGWPECTQSLKSVTSVKSTGFIKVCEGQIIIIRTRGTSGRVFGTVREGLDSQGPYPVPRNSITMVKFGRPRTKLLDSQKVASVGRIFLGKPGNNGKIGYLAETRKYLRSVRPCKNRFTSKMPMAMPMAAVLVCWWYAPSVE